MWTFSVTEPKGRCQVTSAHGTSPPGRDADTLIRGAVADMFKQYTGLQLASTARRRSIDLVDAKGKKAGEKVIVILEGTYAKQPKQTRQFRNLITAGGGLMLNQRIEAAEGHLDEFTPILLQILANLRVAKGVYGFDEGGKMAQTAQGQPKPMHMAPQQLASGWARFQCPVRLAKGGPRQGRAHRHLTPPRRSDSMVAGAELRLTASSRTGRAGRVGAPNSVAPSDALPPSPPRRQAWASNFRFLVRQAASLIACSKCRAFAGPLRSAGGGRSLLQPHDEGTFVRGLPVPVAARGTPRELMATLGTSRSWHRRRNSTPCFPRPGRRLGAPMSSNKEMARTADG